jgi:quercetin dioxygenase-like cupin family protein
MRSGLVTLAPGKDVGTHSTEDYEEMIIILEGQGELEAEGAGRRAIGAGQVAYNPPDTRHNVINTGDGPLRYIYVVSKAR